MDIELDTSWINKYEETEKKYEKFYKKPVEKITFFYCYISTKNEIYKIRKDIISLKDGMITKEELIKIIKSNEIEDNIIYRFKRLIQYNDKTEIEHIYNNKNDMDVQSDFIKIVNCATLDDMNFDDTIGLFEKLNSIFFLFKERSFKNKKKTRKRLKNI